MVLVLLGIMVISLLVISATTFQAEEGEEGLFFTKMTLSQLQWFVLGWAVYLFFAWFDYNRLREWTWVFYLLTLLSLIGLFFVPSVQNTHRWYRLPGIGIGIQPSEYAKLSVVLALSWFFERKGERIKSSLSLLQAVTLVIIPFLLILKQPDLGSALVLYPTALVIFYVAGVSRKVVWTMTLSALLGMLMIALLFLEIIPHEKIRPYATTVLKEYQFERLNPNTYHQKASQTAIALGGLTGSGWRESQFTGRHWLPESHTDSIFAAYAEEFGLVGVAFLLFLFYGVLYCSFQAALYAKDRFGRLLAAGISAYLAMHFLVNMGMMCGFLPITGIPLPLMSYGGSSVLTIMATLGIIQSIYSRRFLF